MTSRIKELLACVSYKDWYLKVDDTGRPYLQWHMYAPDYTLPGQPVKFWPCRKWWLSGHMTETELVQTAFAAALQAEEHECREAFHYRGARPFQPHVNINALVEASQHTDARA